MSAFHSQGKVDAYLIADERKFIALLGTGYFGANKLGWDRIRYLREYRSTLDARTNWSGCPGESVAKSLADSAIRAELDSQQPERGTAHVCNHDGRVRVHVNAEGSAT